MVRVHSVAALVILLVASSAMAANVVAYEGLGPNNTWSGSGNWFGDFPGISSTLAQKFTATASGNFEELYAAIKFDPNNSDRSWTLRLLTDQSDSPGSVLWETTSETWPVAEGSVFHLDGLNGPRLTAGDSYWLQADKPVVLGCAQSWAFNDQGYTGSFAISNNDGPWAVYDDDLVRAMRVLVTPEPVTASLLLSGLALLLRRRK